MIQKRFLLLIQIGPVQDFIATARRTRDLYAGSRLLSEAAYAIAKELENTGATLIFPAPSKSSPLSRLHESGIPNVVLAIVKAEGQKAVASLAKELKERAQQQLLKVAGQAFDKAASLLRDRQAAEAEVLDLLEFYWAARPMERDSCYPEVRKRVYAILAARKNLRDFSDTSKWAAPVYKSSLDGALEGVIHADADEKQRVKLGLRKGEMLSGVDLTKRLYPAENFASTTHLAALPFLKGLSEKQLERVKQTLDELQREFSVDIANWNIEPVAKLLGKRDPGLLFPSRLRDFGLDGKDLERAQERLVRLYRELGREPYPYYALLHADGDRMGKAIEAVIQGKAKDSEAPYLRHRELSACLAQFALKVKEIVPRHEGSLVYSGGDDVLALLPLNTALEAAADLAKSFAGRMHKFKVDEGPGHPSLSVGLALVHHLFDLGEALNLARRAEKVAKEERNSLAIIASPRSGAEVLARDRWNPKSAEWADSLVGRLHTFADWLNQERIPTGWAYELRALWHRLGTSTAFSEIFVHEALRLLKRKKTSLSEKELARLQTLIEERREALINELLIARYVARAKKLAGRS